MRGWITVVAVGVLLVAAAVVGWAVLAAASDPR
jgi:hypothetical protein